MQARSRQIPIDPSKIPSGSALASTDSSSTSTFIWGSFSGSTTGSSLAGASPAQTER